MRRTVPIGLVPTALVILLASVGCGRLSSHPVVLDAKAEIERNPRVLAVLAGPEGKVTCSPKVTGRANETDGIAAMEFEAGGPRGRGTVIVEGKKLGTQWSVTRLELRPASGEAITLTADLEARTGTDTPKFDPTAAAAAPSTTAPPPPTEIEIALPPGGPPP